MGFSKQLALASLAALIIAGVASALPQKPATHDRGAASYSLANDCSGRISRSCRPG